MDPAALTQQIHELVIVETDKAKRSALREIDAKSAGAISAAKNAVIASGLIGGVLGAGLVLIVQRILKKRGY